MAAVRRAFVSLFGTVEGLLPTPSEIDAISKKVFDDLLLHAHTAKPEIRVADLYRCLFEIRLGAITEAGVYGIFDKPDADGSGYISFDEFHTCVMKVYSQMTESEDLSNDPIPDNLVVPGSTRLNSLSGTGAFSMRVVRRSSMRRMWRIFEDLDLNHDSRIALGEFKKYLQRNKPEYLHMASSIFHSLDKERSGRISFRQLLEGLYPEATPRIIRDLIRMARPEQKEDRVPTDVRLMEDIRFIFNVYDDDESGTLDVDEFVNAMQLAGFSEDEASDMFASASNGGTTAGEISFEEFQKWYVKSALRAQRVAEEMDMVAVDARHVSEDSDDDC